MPTSVRLDPDTRAMLGRLAQASGRTKSAIIRDALARLAESEAAAPVGPYELVQDLIGIADGGPEDLAQRHKQAIGEGVARNPRG